MPLFLGSLILDLWVMVCLGTILEGKVIAFIGESCTKSGRIRAAGGTGGIGLITSQWE